MGKLIEVTPDRMDYCTAGRGLGASATVIGAAMSGFCLVAAGAPGAWNAWTWGIAGAGGLLVVGGIWLIVRGPEIWRFDRRAGTVTPPSQSKLEGFGSTEITAVTLTAPRGMGPSLLLLSRKGDRTHTLEVGGATERSSYRIDGLRLAGFLGVPFEDQTKR